MLFSTGKYVPQRGVASRGFLQLVCFAETSINSKVVNPGFSPRLYWQQ